jgi:hypothetical protein
MQSIQRTNQNNRQSLSTVQRLQDRIEALGFEMLNQMDQLFEPRRIAPRQLRFSGYAIVGGSYLVFWVDTSRLYHLSVDELIEKRVTDRLSTVARREVKADYLPRLGLTYSIALRDVPKASESVLPRLVNYDLNLTPARPLSIPFGVTAAGFQWLDLDQLTHILVAGASQSGKSNWTQGLLTALSCHNSPDVVQFAICDPKGEFVHWNQAAHLLDSVATTGAESLALILRVMALSDQRKQLFESVTARNYRQYTRLTGKQLPRIVVLVDEFVDIIEEAGGEFMSTLKRLATKCASYGIHLVLTTASPKADVVDSTVRAQCTTRLCFRVSEAGHSEAVFGKGRSDAFKLPGIKGRFLAVLPDAGDLVLGQSLYLDDTQLDQVQATLKRQYRSRSSVVDMDRSTDESDADDMAQSALVLSAEERQWVAWALERGNGRFNVGRISAKFNVTNNARNPVRLLGKRLEEEGWLLPPEKPTEARVITEELRREFQDL